jgi:hypothetical protein
VNGVGTTSVSINLPFTDTGSSTGYTATIDWGDGTADSPDTSTVTPTAPSGTTPGTVAATHPYNDGDYTATVTITSANGASASSSTSIEIEVGGAPSTAPSGVTATAVGGNVSVTWSALSLPAGYVATGYNVYGSADTAHTNWVLLDSVDASQTSDNLSGLTAGATYEFEVAATNDFPNSSPTAAIASNSSSNPLQITAPVIPDAPTGLTATLTAGNVTLSWTSGDPTNPTLATSYNVYESTDGGTTFNYFDSVTSDNPGTDAPATTYTATGLAAGTTPLFQVTAADASGESSPATATDGTTTNVGVAVPTGVSNVTTSIGASSGSGSTSTSPVTINWTPNPAAVGYLIGRTDDVDTTGTVSLIATVPGEASDSYTDSTALSTDSYTYTVQPYYSSSAPTTLNGNGSGSSSTADDFTGNISGFTATVTGTTVNFAWSYQGGTTGFELEEEDQSDPGTNYQLIQAPTGRTATVTGLNPGDQYSFHLRADRSDGTVSDYVEASADIAPRTPTQDPNEALTPPSGISNPQPDPPSVAYWSGTVDGSLADYDSPGYAEDVGVISDQDNPLHINLGPDDASECSFGPVDPTSDPDTFNLRMDGSSGDTYTVGAYFHTGGAQVTFPPTGEQYSPLAGTVSITMGGTKAPAPELSLGEPDSAGDPTVNWVLPTGTNAGGIYLYSLTTNNGKPTVVSLGFFSGDDTGQATLTHLPLGKSTIFALDFANGPGIDVSGFSPYSNNVQVTAGGPPAAPAAITATAVMQSDDTDDVAVHWVNTPNNEIGYELQRSVDGGGFQTIATLGADDTSYVDKSIPYNSDGDADLVYQVMAVGAAPASPPATPDLAPDLTPPTTAPTSAPAVSLQVDGVKVSVTDVEWHLGSALKGVATPAAGCIVHANQFNFQNYITVQGTNLQLVGFTQYVHGVDTYTDFQGNVHLKPGNASVMNTGPGYAVDGYLNPFTGTTVPMPDAPIRDLGNGNTSGFAVEEDDHSVSPYADGITTDNFLYTYLAHNEEDFQDDFSLLTAKQGPLYDHLYSFDWGYTWDNSSYKFTPNATSNNFTAPVPLECAYERVNGLGSGILTGRGVNLNLLFSFN